MLTTATLPWLAVILTGHGMGADVVGLVLAAALVPAIGGTALAGPLLARFAAARVAFAGQALCLVAFASFEFTVLSPWPAAVSRALLGLGFGLSFPALMLYAKNRLAGAGSGYWFGAYAGVFTLTQALGPVLGEAYLGHVGVSGFFVAMSLPLAVALGLMGRAWRTDASPERKEGGAPLRYAMLLRDCRLSAPLAAGLAIGMLWGFVLSFLTLYLQPRQVAAGWFFVPCTLAVLAVRLGGAAPRLDWRPERLAAAVLVLMGSAYLLLWAAPMAWAVALTGALFGAGYGVGYPLLSLWVSDQFKPGQRAKPVALFNTCYHVGLFATPLVGGLLVAHASTAHLVLSLGIAGLCAAALPLLLTPRGRPRRGQAADTAAESPPRA